MTETATSATLSTDATSEQAGQGQVTTTQITEGAPATEAPELGEAGKRALEAERRTARDALKRAETLERELETLRTASQTEHEKAITQARKEGAAELRTSVASKMRASAVRSALQAEGCIDPDICAHARDFADLEVNDDLEVPELSKVIAAFKKAHPAQFTRAAAGTGDGGARSEATPPKARNLAEAVTAHYAPKQ